MIDKRRKYGTYPYKTWKHENEPSEHSMRQWHTGWLLITHVLPILVWEWGPHDRCHAESTMGRIHTNLQT
jgi:hypothetical protein